MNDEEVNKSSPFTDHLSVSLSATDADYKSAHSIILFHVFVHSVYIQMYTKYMWTCMYMHKYANMYEYSCGYL